MSGAHTAEYALDAARRMTRASADDVGTTYYACDATGAMTYRLLGNGCFTYFAYDRPPLKLRQAGPAGRISSLRNCFSDGSPIVYFEYGYDAAVAVCLLTRPCPCPRVEPAPIFEINLIRLSASVGVSQRHSASLGVTHLAHRKS